MKLRDRLDLTVCVLGLGFVLLGAVVGSLGVAFVGLTMVAVGAFKP